MVGVFRLYHLYLHRRNSYGTSKPRAVLRRVLLRVCSDEFLHRHSYCTFNFVLRTVFYCLGIFYPD